MKKRKILKTFLMVGLFGLTLSACGGSEDPTKDPSPTSSGTPTVEPSTSQVTDERYQIYELAVQAGYQGTYEEWLESIRGADGSSLLNGAGAPSNTKGNNGDTYIDTTTWDVYIKVGGSWSKFGNIMGQQGEPGKSAYELYCEAHPEYTGTEQEWLDDLINGRLGNKEVHTITFDTHGGSSVETQYIYHGEKITKPEDPTKEGVVFKGWTYQDELWSFAGYVVTEDMVLDATWGTADEVDDDNPQQLAFHPLDDGNYAVSIGNAHELTEIVIPATYKGKEVVKIGMYAFMPNDRNQHYESITIPKTIKEIGRRAIGAAYEEDDNNRKTFNELKYEGTYEEFKNISFYGKGIEDCLNLSKDDGQENFHFVFSNLTCTYKEFFRLPGEIDGRTFRQIAQEYLEKDMPYNCVAVSGYIEENSEQRPVDVSLYKVNEQKWDILENHGIEDDGNKALEWFSLTPSYIYFESPSYFYLDKDGDITAEGLAGQTIDGYDVFMRCVFNTYGLVKSLLYQYGNHTEDITFSYSIEEDLPQEDPLDHVFACRKNSAIHYLIGGGWNINYGNEMEAASINDIKALDADLGAALEERIDNIKYLYVGQNINLSGDYGWTTNVKKDGEIFEVDMSQTIQACRARYDTEWYEWFLELMMPSTYSHAENLTPETLFVAENWAEEADEDGFNWNSYPAAFEAGVYTFIAVEYNTEATQDTFSCGLALIPVTLN